VTGAGPRPGYHRVRVLCVDPAGRVLLLKWHDPVGGNEFYEPPGGGIEPGESLEQAAARELYEETGIAAPLAEGFVPVERRHTWMGEHRHEIEPFFLARVERTEVQPAALTESETGTLTGWIWASSPADLDAPHEPAEVFSVLAELEGR
jgi:8-oxo-dGTP pyrophosphatase MutT (NUDIX family)